MKVKAWFLIAFFLLVYIGPLGARPLFIPDEIRYGEIPQEMIDSGDYIVPRLAGLRYFEKPVLGYWMTAASIGILGKSGLALRLPAALSVGLAALLLFLVVRRFTGREEAAVGTTAVLLSFIGVYGLAEVNTLDGPLFLFMTAAMSTFFLACLAEDRRGRMLYLALLGAACGLAFLTKGLIGLVIPGLVILPFLVWDRGARKLIPWVWLPALTFLIVALPWSLAIHFREPEFWRHFVWEQHFQRFLSEEAQHRESYLFYLPVLLAGMLPWTFTLPSWGPKLKAGFKGSEARLFRFAVCWFLMPVLFFSFSKGKLATYIAPAFPGLAVLIWLGLEAYFRGEGRLGYKTGFRLWAGLLVLVAAGLLVVHFFGLAETEIYGQGETWKLFFTGLALLVWAGGAFLAAKEKGLGKSLVRIVLATGFFLAAVQFALPAYSLSEKAPARFFEKYGHLVGPDTHLYADSEMVAPVCWFLGRRDVFCLNTPGELEHGLSFEDSRDRYVPLDHFRKWVKENKQDGVWVIFLTESALKSWQEARPDLIPQEKYVQDDFVLAVWRTHAEE